MRGLIDRGSHGPSPHSHGGPAPVVATSRRVKYITMSILLVVASATALGLILLWPNYAKVAEVAERAPYAAPGVTFERGEILSLAEDCPSDSPASGAGQTGSPEAATGENPASGDGTAPGGPAPCLLFGVGLLSGPDSGRLVEIPVRGSLVDAGLQVGDHLELMAHPLSEQQAAEAEAETSAGYEISRTYDVSGVFRGLPLVLLTILFAAVVIAVGRIRGFLALLALGVSIGVLLGFVLPALVAGGPGLLIGLVGSSAIMFVILYFVHGPNLRTTAALIGTLCGILIMAGISLVAVATTRLSGIGDDGSGFLSAVADGIDFRGLLTCAIVIAGLGILNDVTITQASAVWELRAAAPSMPRSEVYQRAMRIGRDHIASTVYTVVFAYVGAAMSVLILLLLFDRPILSLLTREDLVTEIVRTLCGSVGLVLAVPITTWVATLFLPAEEGREALPAEEPAS